MMHSDRPGRMSLALMTNPNSQTVSTISCVLETVAAVTEPWPVVRQGDGELRPQCLNPSCVSTV